jgi:hypothetical protein
MQYVLAVCTACTVREVIRGLGRFLNFERVLDVSQAGTRSGSVYTFEPRAFLGHIMSA